ncbi:MAG: hypothetical protein MUE98_06745 [Rhodobacteraceae bacterium]|jgi:hypothetical protein|nr:hypothetical protein [Paracoccaceae bacterium]
MTLTGQQTWMKAGAAAVIASGVVLALGAHPATAGLTRMVADLVVWPPDGAQVMAAAETRVFAAISGGVLAGWGWALWLLAGEGMARMPDLTRRIWTGSVLVWFALDSAGSLAAGAPVNVLGNLGFLALLLGPLAGPGRAGRPA